VGNVISSTSSIFKEIMPSLSQHYGLIINLFGLLGGFLGLILIQRFGRVTLLQIGALVIGLSFFIAGYNFLLGK
jgi:hypothetical protein